MCAKSELLIHRHSILWKPLDSKRRLFFKGISGLFSYMHDCFDKKDHPRYGVLKNEEEPDP